MRGGLCTRARTLLCRQCAHDSMMSSLSSSVVGSCGVVCVRASARVFVCVRVCWGQGHVRAVAGLCVRLLQWGPRCLPPTHSRSHPHLELAVRVAHRARGRRRLQPARLQEGSEARAVLGRLAARRGRLYLRGGRHRKGTVSVPLQGFYGEN